MPTTYPTELKVKTVRRYEKGETIKACVSEDVCSLSVSSASILIS